MSRSFSTVQRARAVYYDGMDFSIGRMMASFELLEMRYISGLRTKGNCQCISVGYKEEHGDIVANTAFDGAQQPNYPRPSTAFAEAYCVPCRARLRIVVDIQFCLKQFVITGAIRIKV